MLVLGPPSRCGDQPQSTPLAFSSAGAAPGVLQATVRHPVRGRSLMPGEGVGRQWSHQQWNHQHVRRDLPRRSVFSQIFVLAKQRLQHVRASQVSLPDWHLRPFLLHKRQYLSSKCPLLPNQFAFSDQAALDSPPTGATQPGLFDLFLGILDYPLKITPDPHFARVPSQPTQFLFKPLFGLGFAPTKLLRQGPFDATTEQGQHIVGPPQVTLQIEVARLCCARPGVGENCRPPAATAVACSGTP